MKRFVSNLAAAFAVAAALPALATTLEGRVVGVTDGDTIRILVDRGVVKVRLSDIDTPERGQPWGSRSKQALSELVYEKQARVEVRDIDRYGRSVGRVFVGHIDVNAELVQTGNAWVYRKYSRDPSLIGLEIDARKTGRGLWGLPETQRAPPWKWRRRAAETRRTPVSPPTAPVIGNKRSRIYHRRDCPSYGAVSERNRIRFKTVNDAEVAGFRKAMNCP